MDSTAIEFKKPKIKTKRIILNSVLAVVLLVLTGIGAVSVYIGMQLLHPKREAIMDTPGQYALVSADISFSSSLDNTQLKGWWIPAQNNGITSASAKTVVFIHGYTDSRDMKHIHDLALAQYLAAAGYNTLLFDLRNAGESGGDLTSVGQNEKYDVLSAVDFAIKQKGSQQVALLGWSMGAATAIMAGAESRDVVGIIADSPFSDLESYLVSNLSKWSNLPEFPFTPVIMATIPVISGVHPENVNPLKAVAALGDKRLLLIHSKDDESIPCANSQMLYDAVRDKANAEIWLTDKAGHVESFVYCPDEYETRVAAFLKKCMD